MAKLSQRPLALLAAVLLCIMVVVALTANVLAPYDPHDQELRERLASPSAEHWLGTDELGRDELSRIIWGSRTSLTIAAASVSAAILASLPLGLLAGYYGRYVGGAIMRLVDVIMAFPGILVALAVISVLGPGLRNVIIAIAIYSIPTYVRLVRGGVLQVKTRDFVLAARAVGVADIRIMTSHILPNVIGLVIVQGSLSAGTAILTGAALSFLGIGVQPPAAEWGLMMSTGRLYMRATPHIIVFPGLAIMVVVLSLNILGDTLRDFLDPLTRH